MDEYDKNIEKVKNNVINNYKIFWDKQYKEELKDELKFLSNTDSLYYKFNELEGSIIRLLDELTDIKEEMERDEKNKKVSFRYLQERYDNTKEEYELLEEKLKIEKSQMSNLTRK